MPNYLTQATIKKQDGSTEILEVQDKRVDGILQNGEVVGNKSQSIDNSTSRYPSNKAVKDYVDGQNTAIETELNKRIVAPSNPVVGKLFAVKSVNPDGTFVGEWVDAPTGGGGGAVNDVQIRGTSILQNGVANIPSATGTTYGTVKVGGGQGIINRDGSLTLDWAYNGSIAGRDVAKVLRANNIPYALRSGLGSPSDSEKNAWTDEEKANARNLLGIVESGEEDESDIYWVTFSISVSGDSFVFTSDKTYDEIRTYVLDNLQAYQDGKVRCKLLYEGQEIASFPRGILFNLTPAYTFISYVRPNTVDMGSRVFYSIDSQNNINFGEDYVNAHTHYPLVINGTVFDGSQRVDMTIGEQWELIADVTTTEELVNITIDKDSNGRDFDLNEAFVLIDFMPHSSSHADNAISLTKNNAWGPMIAKFGGFSSSAVKGKRGVHIKKANGFILPLATYTSCNDTNMTETLIPFGNTNTYFDIRSSSDLFTKSNINCFCIGSHVNNVGIGTNIKIWGVRK